MLDLFRDGFCICGGPFGSGMWKNWKVAALKYFRPVTYMACARKTRSGSGKRLIQSREDLRVHAGLK